MPVVIDGMGLTFKQRIFCDEYLKDYDRRRAAIAAGYSKDTPLQMASENLRKPHLIKYMGKKMKDAIEKAGVGIDWRLDVLKKTAEACLSGSADSDGCVNAKGAIGVVSEINKMAGDHAATTSNVNVSESKLEDAEQIAQESEKEINEIKSF